MTISGLELGQEYPPEGEEQLIEQLMQGSQHSMEHKPHPPTLRDQHPKSHGYVQAEFIVENNLTDDLKVGVFKEPKTYEAWIRFSNGGQPSDKIPDVRGMALKLIGVAGSQEQDFVFMNSPIFFIKDLEGYSHFFPVVAAIKAGRIQLTSPPVIPEELLPDFQKIAYAFKFLNGITSKVTPSPLEISYWSSTPYRFGEGKAIKFSAVPHQSPTSFDPKSAADNYLREALTKYLATQDACFDFKIQFQTDAEKMPIEDPTVEWDEQDSPFIKVATIKIPAQDFNTEERKTMDERQSFSPWHTLPEHQPLGGVNRGRKIYADLAKIRNDMNQG